MKKCFWFVFLAVGCVHTHSPIYGRYIISGKMKHNTCTSENLFPNTIVDISSARLTPIDDPYQFMFCVRTVEKIQCAKRIRTTCPVEGEVKYGIWQNVDGTLEGKISAELTLPGDDGKCSNKCEADGTIQGEPYLLDEVK